MKEGTMLKNVLFFFALLSIVLFAALAAFEASAYDGPPVPPGLTGDGEDGIIVEGTLSGTIPLVTVSTNTTLTTSQISGHMIVLTGDGTTATLPAVSADTVGASAYFYVGDATAKHIDVNGSDLAVLGDTALDDGDKVSIAASSRGDTITFICIDTTGWVVPNPPTSATDGG